VVSSFNFRAVTGLQSKLTMLKQMEAMCDMDPGRVCSLMHINVIGN
jgi:hypothetical protein